MVHPGSDAANETTHTTERPSILSCSRLDRIRSIARRHRYTQTRGTEAVQCRAEDRNQKSTYHRRRDTLATRVSQLDQCCIQYKEEKRIRPTIRSNSLDIIDRLETGR